MGRGKEIRIYLASGTVTGIRAADIPGWTGLGLLFPRNHIGDLKDWSEAAGSCVYFLLGLDDESDEPIAYIGQTDDITARVKDHDLKKEFWNELIVFNSKDANFNAAHIRYLEARLCQVAKQTGRYRLENKTNPKVLDLSRAETDTMEDYLDNLRLLLGALGHRILETSTNKQKTPKTERCEDGELVEIYDDWKIRQLYLRTKGMEARGMLTDEGFGINEGSQAVKEDLPSQHPGNRRLRQRLIDTGVLSDHGDHLEFEEYYMFKSPSRAAAIVCGLPVNGWELWKTADGETLRQIEQEAMAEQGEQHP